MSDRQYQAILIDESVEQLSTKRKILLQLPTGGGKTHIFTLLADRYVKNASKSVLILVHRIELLQQAQKTIQKLTGINPVLITSETRNFRVGRIYIGMVESTMSRLNLFHNVGLIIIDECHIANFNKVHHVFLDELILGVTATPIAASKKEPLNKYYQDIVAGPHIKELIKLGFLSQNITRCPKDIVDTTKLEIDRLKGDFKEGAMALEYKKPKHIINLLEAYHSHCLGKKTLIFNVNKSHSLEVTKLMNMAGHPCKHLDSDCSDQERAEILHWFKITKNAILCNIMIATVGFDEPTIERVICNFATLSLPKWIQTSGRGGRVIDHKFIQEHGSEYPYDLSLKFIFEIIDMGGNAIRFGDWSDERDWKYIFNNPDRPGEGTAPVKTCPECEGLVHAALMICPLLNQKGEICNHVFDKKKAAEEKGLGEMIVLTKGINVEQLIENHKKKHEYFSFYEIGDVCVKAMFDSYIKPSDNFKRKAFEAYYELCIEWYDKALANKPGYPSDIRNDAWHIAKAKKNFDDLVKKYEKIYEAVAGIQICHICGYEAEGICDHCEYPTCSDCYTTDHTEDNTCKKCRSIQETENEYTRQLDRARAR
jgi:superfamily II DNA or RNA helicase